MELAVSFLVCFSQDESLLADDFAPFFFPLEHALVRV